MREASLTFLKWEPQVKTASWKDSRKRGAQRFGNAFDNNSKGTAFLRDLNMCTEL